MSDHIPTPYDTSAVLEPFVLVKHDAKHASFDDYGKVEFDNSQSATLISARAIPEQDGVRVELTTNFNGNVRVVVDGRELYLPTI